MPSPRTAHRKPAQPVNAHFLIKSAITGLLLIGAIIGFNAMTSHTEDTTPDTPIPAVQPIPAPTTPKPVPAKHQTLSTTVSDDDPSFDCRTDGNRTCGPDNAQHVTPGCYWAGKLLVAWQPAMAQHWVNCGTPTADDWHREYRATGGKYGAL